MPKPSTIKNDPLADAGDPLALVIPDRSQEAEARRKETETKKGQGGQEAKGKQVSHKKEKLTVHLTHDLIERVKNAAYWNPRLTIAAIAERGIAQVIEQIEKENGGPSPAREEELKGGRPIGSRTANG